MGTTLIATDNNSRLINFLVLISQWCLSRVYTTCKIVTHAPTVNFTMILKTSCCLQCHRYRYPIPIHRSKQYPNQNQVQSSLAHTRLELILTDGIGNGIVRSVKMTITAIRHSIYFQFCHFLLVFCLVTAPLRCNRARYLMVTENGKCNDSGILAWRYSTKSNCLISMVDVNRCTVWVLWRRQVEWTRSLICHI